MSSQSIFVKSIDVIKEDSQKVILKNAHYYILKKRFSLIKEINNEKVRHANKLLTFICSENCELKDFINRTLLEGEGLEVTCASSKAITTTIEFSDYKENILK